MLRQHMLQKRALFRISREFIRNENLSCFFFSFFFLREKICKRREEAATCHWFIYLFAALSTGLERYVGLEPIYVREYQVYDLVRA